jgi:hypothetical protein
MSLTKLVPGVQGVTPVLGDLESILQVWENFDTGFALFFGSTQTAGTQTNAHIPDSNTGYFDGAAGSREIYKLGQAATTMGTEGGLIASPYPTRLRPVYNSANLLNRPRIYISRIEFRAYDVTKIGVPEQNASVLAEIEASAGTINDAYIQARYFGGEVGGWQPNFFRPKIIADSRTVFGEISGGSSFGSNRGDMSIGLPLPFEHIPPMPIPIGKFTNKGIQAWAGAGQIIDVSGTKYIQRYAISCLLELLIYKK